MRFASGISDLKDPTQALEAVLKKVTGQLKGDPCHLTVLFASSLYQANFKPILKALRAELKSPVLIGCAAGGVLGEDQELESTPALSLAAASLPEVKIHPFHVSPEELEEPHGTGFWIEKLGALPAQEPVGILLPEPFSCDAMALVATLNAAYPKMPMIGGLASGAHQAGENTLFLNEEVFSEGAVGAILTGDILLTTIVSQGCRPIGRSYIVTKAEGNIILELAGVPAVEALRKLFITLTAQEQALAQKALFLGIVMNEQRSEFKRGDFLVRNLLGLDPSTGALAIGDRIEVGQTVQFQLRDAETSREDLQHLLKEYEKGSSRSPWAGGLLFNCLGRGKDLYGEPHYDIRTIQAVLGTRPIAGFFCNGEIGPIAGRNFIHGFTSSLGLFRPRSGS